VLARTGLSGFFDLEPSAARADGIRTTAGSLT
jgi:hypothetical protein